MSLRKRFRILQNKRMKWIFFGLLFSFSAFFILAISVYFYVFVQGPPPLTSEQNTVIFSEDEQVIGIKQGSQNRYWVKLDQISPHVKDAFIVTEDQSFYDHFGFDLSRIAVAAFKNVSQMEKVQGASTITQQYARNLYLTHQKTWKRKINEALYALRLEMFYGKDEILEGYLNTIYFGHGNYGIEAASRYYFNKHADELSVAEASLLAAIPKGPSYYSPIDYPEHATNRQQLILSLLANSGKITEEQWEEAKATTLTITQEEEREGKQIAPYFQDVVMSEAVNILDKSKEEIQTGGYKIYTTIDVDMQEQLETITDEKIDDSSSIQIGAINVDPKTGAIKSLIGGRDYVASPFNRAIQAKRMAGSTFKPFLYYAALERGYTPATPLESSPTYFELDNGKVYAPSNYNGYYANSPITLAQALALSDNIYAVKTNVFFKPKTLVETARKFGIKSDLPAVPSLALGTASVSVLEMAKGYSLLANKGKEVIPHTITKITDSEGKVLYKRPKPSGKQVLDPKHAFVLTHLMTGIFDESLNDYSRVTGASLLDVVSRPYAAKSGTTNADSWMIGFSPQAVTAIWTGYDKGDQLTKVEDQTYAKDIWGEYMEAIHQDIPFEAFKPPEGVKAVFMDPHSGKLAHTGCPNMRLTYFIEGTEPRTFCSLHDAKDFPFPQKEGQEEEQENDSGSIWEWVF
ncbi:1A family penicillin-binding protein [Salirhabdus euzebyi]|uniref:1A family penicillin-binding protein n=1 Tax=Salirhabdus euzebyi TaxID=394506 RepID=A0A841Q673_9BACI|nr:PBP1A family penicillin-binding protein [Salirhabdus euzebyi]MBB6453906.1 1A family penicillin-binding protein [Salirhabdus euzebyi]